MTLKFDVDYYDQNERALISATAFGPDAAALVSSGLTLDEEEFLTYSLFPNWRDLNGWRTYNEWKRRVPTDVGIFERYIDLSGGTARANFPDGNPTGVIEHAGVGASLPTANRLFKGLHLADWERIPETTASKTQDFRHPWTPTASTGTIFVQAEAKGSIVRGSVENKTPAISNHRSSIKAKKTDVRRTNNTDVLVGTIAAFPVGGTENARVWLLDPPPEAPEMSARKYRLLSRLHFYLRVGSIVSGTSMLIALRDRLRVLATLNDIDALDGLALVTPAGTPFRFDARMARGKTSIPGKRLVVGRSVPIDASRVLFVGLDLEAFRVAARQRFNDIEAFESAAHESTSRLVTTTVLVDRDDAERAGMEYDPETALDESGRNVTFEATGRVWVDGSGLAMGRLRVHDLDEEVPPQG